jgi:hypothetical protein
MSKSGNKINYSLRLCKGIERKLIKDAAAAIIGKLGTREYKYIGFGSKYFADFIYFHRHLHIDKMVSIEVDKDSKETYEFNKPFTCIDIVYGHSNEKVPLLDYKTPILSWLDYDGKFSSCMLTDLTTQIEKCLSGSILLISYNSKPYSSHDLKRELKPPPGTPNSGLLKQKLEKEIGKTLLPANFDERGLSDWGKFSAFLKKIVDNQISKTLTDMNSASDEDGKFFYKQLFYFDYKDGVEMSTVGGVFYKKGDADKIESCGLEKFDFIRSNDNRCLIDAPILTAKEIRELLSMMPLKDAGNIMDGIDAKIFNEEIVRQFSKYYKYYPKYAEVDF